MSILFRIVSSMNHFQLPLFMLSNVNIADFYAECVRLVGGNVYNEL